MKAPKLGFHALLFLIQLVSTCSAISDALETATNLNLEINHDKKEKAVQEYLISVGSSGPFNGKPPTGFASSEDELIAFGQNGYGKYTYVVFKLASPISVKQINCSAPDSPEKTMLAAVHYANTNWYNKLLKFDNSQFINENFGENADIVSYHDYPRPNLGCSEYKKKFGVILKDTGSGKTSFQFAICVIAKTAIDEKTPDAPLPDKFLVLGFSQQCNNSESLVTALEKGYFNHADAFGRIVYLPSLYSGEEAAVESFFNNDNESGHIRHLLQDRLVGMNVEIRFLRPWSISKDSVPHKVGIFKLIKNKPS